MKHKYKFVFLQNSSAYKVLCLADNQPTNYSLLYSDCVIYQYPFYQYCQTSNISCTNTQNFKASGLV